MTSISDEQLFAHANRLKDKVVLITGGANGIGRETALAMGSRGAHIVVADRDIDCAQRVVAEINGLSAPTKRAIAVKCDVTKWDDQVAMFEQAVKTFGRVDVVIPNAGVREIGNFSKVKFGQNGKPEKPNLTTMDVNLFGVLYTAHLATYYLQQDAGDLKALIFIGSIASWVGPPNSEIYAGAKHAVLGVMRGLHTMLGPKGIRLGCIHPFFTDTAIIALPARIAIAGIPMTPIHRVAGAIVYAASDPDPATNGAAYLMSGDCEVFMIPKEKFKLGVYQMLDERSHRMQEIVKGVKAYKRTLGDLAKIFKKPLIALAISAGLAAYWFSS